MYTRVKRLSCLLSNPHYKWFPDFFTYFCLEFGQFLTDFYQFPDRFAHNSVMAGLKITFDFDMALLRTPNLRHLGVFAKIFTQNWIKSLNGKSWQCFKSKIVTVCWILEIFVKRHQLISHVAWAKSSNMGKAIVPRTPNLQHLLILLKSVFKEEEIREFQ